MASFHWTLPSTGFNWHLGKIWVLGIQALQKAVVIHGLSRFQNCRPIERNFIPTRRWRIPWQWALPGKPSWSVRWPLESIPATAVASVQLTRAKTTFGSDILREREKISNTSQSINGFALPSPIHNNQSTLHYMTLHYNTLHLTILQWELQTHNYTTTLHDTSQHCTTLHYTKSHYTTLHCITLHYLLIQFTPSYITVHSITTTQLHSTTPHNTPLH